jgi:hypothetical protein
VNVHRVRLGVLVGVLAAYAVTQWSSIHGGTGGTPAGVASSPGCPLEQAPPLSTLTPAELRRLRDDVSRVTVFDPRLQPYEQGLVSATVAWSDAEPDAGAALSPDRHVPGGYEMRWWMPNGDDLVADGFVFPGASLAHDFLRQATTTDCRSRSSTHDASFPLGGRNLGWVNPDNFVQQDLYIQRGRRVYRVTVVKAGVGHSITRAAQAEAFALVDGLACALPGAGCKAAGDATPSAIAA